MRPTDQREAGPFHARTPPFVDRAGLLALAVAAVDDRPGLVLLEGESGIGKSRFVTELAARQQVLVGRCHRLREPFPLGPFVQILRSIAATVDLRQLPGPAGALRILVPELAESLPPLPVGTDDLLRKHLMFRGLAGALGLVAPAVVAIDDAHWADEQTLEFLEMLVAEPVDGLSILLAYRGSEVSPSVPALASRAPDALPTLRLALDRWDPDECRDLAAAIVGLPTVTPEFAEHLWHRSSGIPFAVRELLGLLVERGTLAMQDGEWVRRSIEQLAVPPTIRDSVLERIAGLDTAARSLLESAAVLQVPSTVGVLAKVAQVAGGALADALRSAEASGLLVERDGRYEVSHALAADAIYGRLNDLDRADLHGRSADALATNEPTALGQIAYHEREAGRAGWHESADRAAQRAAALGDDEGVISALEPLLQDGAVSRPLRARAMLKLAAAALASPQGDRLIDQIETELGDPLSALTAHERLTLALHLAVLANNHLGDATRVLDIEAYAEADDIPVQARLNLRLWSLQRWLPGQSTETVGTVLAGIRADIDRADLDDRTRTALHNLEVRVRDFVGLPSPDAPGRAGVVETPSTRDTYARYAITAQICATIGDLVRSGRLLDACDGVTDPTVSDSVRRSTVTGSALMSQVLHGRWDQLDPLQDDNGAPQVGVQELLDHAAVSAVLLARRGPTNEVVASIDRTLQAAARGSQPDVLAFALGPRIRATLQGGAPEPVPGLDRFLQAVDDRAILPCLFQALPAVTAILLTQDVPTAETTVTAFDRAAKRIAAPFAAATMPHARALVSLAGQHDGHPAGLDLLLQAADCYTGAHMPYAAAQVSEELALHRAADDPERAADEMATAIREFRNLGASWDLDRCRQFARERGWPVPGPLNPGRTGYRDELSPREQAVVDLVASGLTNKEIAEKLCVSINTVRNHVAAALRKSGVDSRRRLGSASTGRTGGR